MKKYNKYEDYISFQSSKTLDPEKRKKWLNEEWRQKIEGFKTQVFSILGDEYFKEDKKILCIGARTGQEVVALNELGAKNVIGIDIVEHAPYVIKGDMHNLEFDDKSFDLVFTNVIDHSLMPQKMISEVERVLKIDGNFLLQCQIGIDQDIYTEFEIKHPIYDVLPMTNTLMCNNLGFHQRNFAGMNFTYVFTKSKQLTELYKKYGSIDTINVPKEYQVLWEDINLPVQTQKLNNSMIYDFDERSKILSSLSKRGYYLTRIAETFNCKDIAEVGTAEGWQYFNFCKYIKDSKGNTVSTCDPRDVRNKKYLEVYDDKNFTYYNATSKEMSEAEGSKDFFYIDGMHDENTVLLDVFNLQKNQSEESIPVWVFDDFDERFGCYKDIINICSNSCNFKVYRVGKTASGKPSHQALVFRKMSIQKSTQS